MIDYIEIISNVGFPIFVALYMMIRMEKATKEHTEAINKMTLILERLEVKLDK